MILIQKIVTIFVDSVYDSDKEIVILFVLMDIFVKNIMFLYPNCADFF